VPPMSGLGHHPLALGGPQLCGYDGGFSGNLRAGGKLPSITYVEGKILLETETVTFT
jgi:hypothetical protein